MSEQQPAMAVFVLWQSLVVGTYRSFFAAMTRFPIKVGLAAPDRFIELGNQLLECAPFEAPFDGSTSASGTILKAHSVHTQITWFAGLGHALRRFFGTPSQKRIFLCLSEPYAPTALLAWCTARFALGRDFRFVGYAMQNIYKPFSFPLRWVQNRMFARCDAIMVLGQEHENVLRQHGYRGPCWHIPLWFNSQRLRFAPQSQGIRSLPCVGYAGGLTEAKGLDDLASALRILTASGRKAKVRIAGLGPLKPMIEDLVVELNSKGWKAEYLGPLSAEAMTEFYSSLDFLVVPSRTMPNWKEQFGRVIVEAEATGAVALGSNSGEIPTVIGDSTRIFAEKDPAELARFLDSWLWSDRYWNASVDVRKASSDRAFARYSDQALSAVLYEKLQDLTKDG